MSEHRYTYGLRYRPAGYATVPNGRIPGSERPHPDYPVYGVIDYPRRLTKQEAEAFQLERVVEVARERVK